MSKIPVWNLVSIDGFLDGFSSLDAAVGFCVYTRSTDLYCWIECCGVRMNESGFIGYAEQLGYLPYG